MYGKIKILLKNLFKFKFISDSDLQLNANDECEFGIRSLGAVIWYLKRCKMDFQLLSRGRFDIYKPVDIESVELSNQDNINSKHMVIKIKINNTCLLFYNICMNRFLIVFYFMFILYLLN